MSTAPVDRLAARVLLVDAGGRVLLLRWVHPGQPERGSWWITPGGGLDAGEGYREGAVRELFEETGLRVAPDDLGPVLLEREIETELAGVAYRQHEQLFLLRVHDHVVDTSGFTDFELACLPEHRWWTLAELDTTDERLSPRELPALVRAAVGQVPS
ncbi:MAG: NUDIX hydrolase [Mycobacteriales bacterium]